MSSFGSLESALPDYINLGGINEIHQGLKAQSENDWLEDVDELIDGLYAACVDVDRASRFGGVLINESHWENHCRDFAEDTIEGLSDSSLGHYVDWELWAEDMAMDYTKVTVLRGMFFGTWYIRQ